jgi:hypothetical protein
MKHLSVLRRVLFLACLGVSVAKGQAGWEQELKYRMDVTLDDDENSLDGFVRLTYINHSPDTLSFIWFHLWPNAFRTDKTTFSDQMLENGRTDFYFSDREQRGYINRLDFRVNGFAATTEDHPEWLDVVKLLLPHPLTPGDSAVISTPFHEQIPFRFSGGGHDGHSYHLVYWYPEPAVFDLHGWHPMPYLDQGGPYSEFASFDVRITVPRRYVVAASGDLQDAEEKAWLRDRSLHPPTDSLSIGMNPVRSHLSTAGPHRNLSHPAAIAKTKDTATKTLQWLAAGCNRFSWFADRDYLVSQDTVRLESGRSLTTYCYYFPGSRKEWAACNSNLRESVRYYSSLLGDPPGETISLVETPAPLGEQPAYPGLAPGGPGISSPEMDLRIGRLLAHYWLAGIIGTNGRSHPWMSEGISDYYAYRYLEWRYGRQGMRFGQQLGGLTLAQALAGVRAWIDELAEVHADQAASRAAEDFTLANYRLMAGGKTAFLIDRWARSPGTGRWDSGMREYFIRWQGKHPYPGDLKLALDRRGLLTDSLFAALNHPGPLLPVDPNRRIKCSWALPYPLSETTDYLSFLPALGYNMYDHLMLGFVVHNLNLPANRFQFVAAPLYALGSNQINGIGRLAYSWYPNEGPQRIEAGLSASRFSTVSGTDSIGRSIYGGFYKLVPFFRLNFRSASARSTQSEWLEWKTYLIGERSFTYLQSSSDSLASFPVTGPYAMRYLDQLTFNLTDDRVLYPYRLQLQIQQASDFYRLNLTANYFFNYASGGGISVRFFAAKFGYLGPESSAKDYSTIPYQPKLTADRGYLGEDYSYNNYFLGRSEFSGFASQQVMMKDGGLMLRTDLFQGLQGRSANWIAAANFSASIPKKILPAFIPLRIFVDVGTYAEAWEDNPPTSKFLYVAGLQLTLLKGILNFYAPLIYSSDFSNSLKTVPDQNSFLKKISFSLDIQDIDRIPFVRRFLF